MEINTKLMDSIYFYNGTTLTVNLFMPSVLNWTQRGITVTQTTSYPVERHHHPAGHRQRQRLLVDARAHPGLDHRRHRSASTASPQNVTTTPGSYATLTRVWASGDTVTVRLPMRVVVQGRQRQRQRRGGHLRPGRSCPATTATPPLSALPALTVSSVTRTSTTALAFTATANGSHGQPRPVLRRARLQLHRLLERRRRRHRRAPSYRLVNVGQRAGARHPEHVHRRRRPGPAVGRQRHRRPQLGDRSPTAARSGCATSTAARCSAWRTCPPPTTPASCNGPTTAPPTTDGPLVDKGDGTHKIRNVNSGKLLAILNGSTARARRPSRTPTTAAADNRWRFVPNGARRIQNVASGLVLGVQNMSTADGGLVLQWGDTGTADHLWTASSTPAATCGCATATAARCSASRTPARPPAHGSSSGPTTAPPTTAGGCGTASNGSFRIQCANGGRVLGVSGASTAQGAQVVLADDAVTNDRLWRFL